MPFRFDVSELKALRREIRKIKPESPEYARKLVSINRDAAQSIINLAQSNASGMGAATRKAADAIKPRNTTNVIGVRVGGWPGTAPNIFGAKRRTGWYAAGRYGQSRGRQFPEWVGNSWEPGGPGGPYALNPAIRQKLPEVMEAWGNAISELMDELNIPRS